MVIMDLDGVLTDGRIVYGSDGTEYKNFHVHDGYGIARARELGLLLAIISGRTSKVTTFRAKRLQISDCIQGADDKVAECAKLLKKYRLHASQVCYIGDDEFDLPLLRMVGVSVAPCDAIDRVREEVDIVTRTAGGRGAVRELIDAILRAQGLLDGR
jgi:3-deoxy-D-manno-octulosonate 8-phosphate phosphatase (KDO 8-P phosphatase)